LKPFKSTAAMLALALLVSACSSGKQAATSSPSASPSASTLPSGNQTAKPAKLTLSMLINSTAADSNLPQDPSQDFVRKAIEEKFNVELKVIYMPLGTEYVNKLNTLIAANDTPDVWRDGNSDGGVKLALNGVLADMTPFVSVSTMPNYFKYWITDVELNRYKMKNMFVNAPIPFNRSVYRSYYIRKDWLDKLGLKVPTSYDEYYKVLQAFTNNDPDGDGKKNTFGFSTSGGGDSIGLDWPEYIKNGLTFPSFIENNKYVDMQTDPRIQQVVDDILKVTSEGLVDPDWFLNKGTNSYDKAVQGKVGVVLSNDKNFAYDSNPKSLQNDSKALNPKADWVPFSPFGQTALRTAATPGSPFLFSKKTADKDPEKIKRAVQILDWLAGEEGYLLTHYGIEGKHYTRSGNKITLNPQAYQDDIGKKGNFLDIWQFFTPATPEVLGLQVIDPRETDRDREIYNFVTGIPVRPNLGTNTVPPEGFDLGAFRGKQRELQVKMVMEEKSGKKWPEYREELMTKYKGQMMFDAYENQIRAVGVIK